MIRWLAFNRNLMQFNNGFLQDSIKRLRYYKDLGDKTLAQLEEKDLHYQPSSESNSIAMIIQHLHGNMRSRWTNFLTEDGEKEWRQRDAEFETGNQDRNTLLARWNDGWNCFLQALESLDPQDLMRTVTIRTEPLYVYDAILRQLAHYPYHVGQIIYIAKQIRNQEWQSLSIAKGASHEYLEKIKKERENK